MNDYNLYAHMLYQLASDGSISMKQVFHQLRCDGFIDENDEWIGVEKESKDESS